MESSHHRRSRQWMDRDKVISKVISPAIMGRSCPICLQSINERRAAVITDCKHAYCLDCIRRWSDVKRKCPLCNARFDSWFYKINLSSRNFSSEKLPPLGEDKVVTTERESMPGYQRRRFFRSREDLHRENGRSRPFPWRRSFGRAGSVASHVIDERKLQWRASVYSRRLQAVPLSPTNNLAQTISSSNHVKEQLVQRIEPWIRRELMALLDDPDPSIIVHVASSTFIATLDRKLNRLPGRHIGFQDDLVLPLRQFLHDRTDMFLHELRCYAESSFTMETYDAVVEYKPMD